MRISKKILAIALSILMAVSMMPFTVFAATTTVNSVSDFETAVAAATAGDTIQLGANLDFTSDSKYAANSYTSSESYVDISGLTIDLGGYTITNNTAGLKFSGSDCVIKNGKFVGVADSPTRRYGLALWSYEAYVDGSNDSIPTGTVYEQNVVLEDLEVDGGINVLGHRNVVLRDCNVYGNSYYALYLNFASDATIESGEYTAANTKANGIVACYDATSLASEYATKIDITGGSFTVAKTDLVLASSGPVEISGGTYKNANDTAYTVPAKYLAEGAVEDANGEVTQYVAEVNGVKYDTFEKALAAISTVTTATHSNAKDPTYQYKTYVANGTIKLLADTTSNGVIIGSGSNLTIDFNGKTLDINAKPVGSNGTESSAMQLLKDSDITFKNGTLTSTYTYASTDTEYIQRLIQNYANLTLDHMTVGMRGNFKNQLMMSNSNGNITITDSTVSAPDFSWANYSAEQAADQLGAVAMSVGTFSTYTGVNVTVTDSNINGNVNIDNTGANGTAALTLDGGEVTGDIVDKSMNNSTVTNNGATVGGIPEGYEWKDNGDGTSSLAEDTHSVAEVNGAKYDTFEEALAAISSVTTATHSKATDPTYVYKTYTANGTIKLLQDCTTNGIIIGSGSNLTIDFNGKTLDITDKPVGSNGTETIGMQLLKDSDITFENGTLTSTADSSKKIVRLIQNYADLTLDHMTVGMKGYFYDQMTMSNCNGDITITDSTVSAPDFSAYGADVAYAAENYGARAMSVGSINSTAYPDVNVTVTNSTINGYVNIDTSYGPGTTAELTLDGSDVNGNIVDKDMTGATVTNTGSTVDGIPAGYEWNASNVLAPIEDAFNLTVEDMIHMNLYVNAAAYDANEITVTYSDPDKQNGGTKTETFAVSDLAQDDKGRYAVKILAAPAQMRDTVTVTAGSHTYTTTVAAYCEALVAQSNDAELVALAKAMLDYGKACSDEFNYNESAFASQDYYNTDDVTSALNNAAIVNTSSANDQFRSYAYIAKSVPALRIYLNTTEAEAAALGGNAFVDGEATQIMVDPDGNVCVDITGIRAEDLNKEFAVEFNNGLIRINALQFAKAMGGNTDLGRSMYNYYTAAHAYFV